jgi:hypothetical protein
MIISDIISSALRAFIPSSPTVILVHDDHYSINLEHKKYCQLVDPLARDLRALGYVVEVFRYPGSKLRSFELKNHSNSLNFWYFVLYVCGLVLTASNKKAKRYSWYLLLKAIECRWIYAIQPPQYICQASHNAKAIIYDLQHGIITASDPYYSFCFDSRHDASLKPNAILFLYKASYNTWKRLNPPIALEYLGSPYLADLTYSQSSDSAITSQSKLTILFSHQADYGRTWGESHHDTDGRWHKDGIPYCIIDLLSTAYLAIKLYFRVHPLSKVSPPEVQAVFSQAIHKTNSEVSIACSTDIPLPAHLSVAALHVTCHSAVVYEAAEFNIPSIVLSQSKVIKEQFQQLSDEGLVIYSSNSINDFLVAVRKLGSFKESLNGSIDPHRSQKYRTEFLQSLHIHLSNR